MGRKHSRVYRIVLADKKKAVSKQYVENLGFYNPVTKDVVIKDDRVKHWLDLNTEVSSTVQRLLDKKNGVPSKFASLPKVDKPTPKKAKKK